MFPGVGQLVLTGGKLFGTELLGEKIVPFDGQTSWTKSFSHPANLLSVWLFMFCSSVYTANRVSIVMVALKCAKR